MCGKKYKLIARLYENNILSGYRLLDVFNGNEIDEDINRVKIYARQGLIDGVNVDKYGDLHGSKGTDLRRIKRDNIFINDISTYEENDDIRNRYKQFAKFKKRYVFKTIEKYLHSNTNKVCAIYGLRRTGKTVLLIQSIDYLNYNSCAYISLNKKDRSIDLFRKLNDCYKKGIKYVFIDEITVLDDILSFIQTLSDNYASKGMHIIISGTDSYILNIASKNALYNRCEMIRTTYVSFEEFNYLLGKTEIKDYIHYGGVLNRDSFYDIDSMHEYLSTAIVDNIQHSVEVSGREIYGKLHDLISLGLFKRCIELSIQHSNEELAAIVMAKEFKSKEIGSVKDLLSRTLNISELLDLDTITEQIRYYLRISSMGDNQDENLNMISEYYDTVIAILKELNLVVFAKQYLHKKQNESIIFTLPGLRYNQLKETILAFIHDERFQDLSKKDRSNIINKMESDVYGQLAEQTVMLHLINTFGYNNAYKFKGVSSEEIDCIVEFNNYIDLIEVKWSNKDVDDQCNHLLNKEFNNLIESIIGCKVKKRIVLYRGKSLEKRIDGYRISYVNINSFLINCRKYL